MRLAAFLVGAAAAAAGEVAAALLLYSGAGLVGALTLVLTAELAALATGFWAAGSDSGRAPGDFVVSVRRRWLLTLVFFSAAAGFAAAWPLLVREGTTALGQGLGLALLAVLPLYGAGTVLGSLATVARRISVPATFGAATGVLVTGFLLTRLLQPVTLLLLCVTAVAAGALASAAGPAATDAEDRVPPEGAPPDGEPPPRKEPSHEAESIG